MLPIVFGMTAVLVIILILTIVVSIVIPGKRTAVFILAMKLER